MKYLLMILLIMGCGVDPDDYETTLETTLNDHLSDISEYPDNKPKEKTTNDALKEMADRANNIDQVMDDTPLTAYPFCTEWNDSNDRRVTCYQSQTAYTEENYYKDGINPEYLQWELSRVYQEGFSQGYWKDWRTTWAKSYYPDGTLEGHSVFELTETTLFNTEATLFNSAKYSWHYFPSGNIEIEIERCPASNDIRNRKTYDDDLGTMIHDLNNICQCT